MKILQFGDVHLDPATESNTRPALAELVALAHELKPDLIINTGDLSMRRGHVAPWVSLELRLAHVNMSQVAPVVVIAGNHDLASPGEPGAVFGALKASAGAMIWLYESSSSLSLGGGLPHMGLIPYPSRERLLVSQPDLKASEVNAAMSAALLGEAQVLARECPEGSLLVFHGTIAGATTSSETAMPTGLDVVLDEGEIPACFRHVMCGHIHRPQRIGRCVYSGSVAPLTFAEGSTLHGVTMWEGEWPDMVARFIPLRVAHPLITIDTRKDIRPELSNYDLQGAHVRVIEVAGNGTPAADIRAQWTTLLKEQGADQVRVIVERPEAVRDLVEVSAEASLDDLVDMYLRRNPILSRQREEILSVANEVEAALSPEVALRQRAGGYTLLRMEWSNWKSYGADCELDLTESGPVISLEGPNATGKSNAAEIEAFALYGKSVRGRQSLGEVVRAGERDATVAAEFASGGDIWRVERRVKVSAAGVGASEVTLKRLQGTNGSAVWVAASAATGRETDALIESMVGDFDLYRCTRFASQEDVARLLDLTPSQMKETIQAAIATDTFVARLEVARALLSDAEGELQRHEAHLAVWRDIASGLAVRREAAGAAEAQLAAVRQRLVEAETELGAATDGRKQAEQALEGIEGAARAWDAAEARAQQTARALADLEASLQGDRDRVQRAGDAERERQDLPAARNRLAELKARAVSRAALVSAELSARNALSAAEDSLRRHREQQSREQATLRRACDAAVKAVNEARRQAQQEQETLASRVAMLDTTPFGEQCAEARCRFVMDAVKARQGAEQSRLESEARIRLLEQQLVVTQSELVTADESATRLVSELLASVALARQNAQDAATTLIGSEDESEAVRHAEGAVARLEALDSVIREADAARARLQLADDRMDEARRQASLAREELAALGARPSADEQARAVGSWRSREDDAEEAVSQWRQQVDDVVERLAECRAAVTAAEDAERRVGEAAERSSSLSIRVSVTRAWVDACGRDGLPYLMLERALPALESHANHFLCGDLGSGLRVSIDGARELQSGAQRSEVVIRYANDFGEHSLAAASGFERVAIGYALRVALAQVLSEARGIPLTHIIADEGWGAFDEANTVRIGQPMVRRIADRCGRFLLISHVAAILAACDTRITVIGDPTNGSRLQVQR